MSFFIVPAMDSVLVAPDRRKRPNTPKKSTTARNDTRMGNSGLEAGHNFLMKSGARSYEHKIEQMKAAASADLKSTNDALAGELMRSRVAAEEERGALNHRVTSLQMELRMEQEKLRSAFERAEHEARQRYDLEMQQQHRMKEIQKRFREEHTARITAETECVQLRQLRERLEGQVKSLDSECTLHRETLADLRSNNSRLEATVAADAAVVAELRSRLSNSDSRLETEQGARLDVQTRVRAVEVQLAMAQERNGELSNNLSESQSRLRAASSRLSVLEDDCSSFTRQLLAEKESSAGAREGAARLQRDLASLQSAAVLAASAHVADKSELERLHRELAGLQEHDEGLSTTVAELREAKVMLSSELAVLQGTLERLQQEAVLSREEMQSVRDKSERAAQLQEQQHGDRICDLQAAAERKIVALEAVFKESQLLLHEARDKVAKLAEELKVFGYQSEHFKQVFADNDRLTEELQRAENTLRQKEALLSESLASHNAQLEMWRAEATEVAQAASKWKQRSLLLQSQVDSKESELRELSEGLREMTSRATRYEGECSKQGEVVQTVEARSGMMHGEITSLRSQLQDAISAQQTMSRRSDAAQQELRQRDAQVDKLAARLSEEQDKASRLRQDVASLTAAHVKELDSKSRLLTDVTLAVQKEERIRMSSQQEAGTLREHLQTLERELRNAQTALASVADSKLRRESSYAAAEVALQQAAATARMYHEVEDQPKRAVIVRAPVRVQTGPQPDYMRPTDDILEQAALMMSAAQDRWDDHPSEARHSGETKLSKRSHMRDEDVGGGSGYRPYGKVVVCGEDEGGGSMDDKRSQLDQRRYRPALLTAQRGKRAGDDDDADDGDAGSALDRLQRLLDNARS